MRVLHLDSGRTMRGGQWQVLRLIEGLCAAGVESVLLAHAGGPLLEKARAQGWQARPLGRLPFERGYDLVHAHDSRSHTLAALLCRSPLVVSRRVAFPGAAPGAIQRWKYGRAARYLAVSAHVKSILAGRGVPPDKIEVVYDGVPLIAGVRTADAPARALAPANLDDPRKGAALALEGARLAGIELTLSRNLERDLASATLFVYITDSEGLGSAVLLAMSAGVPVVASRTGGLPEIVRHGETGLLVENRAPAIAVAIRALIDDPEAALRMGAAGRRRVQECFTVEAMVRRTMEVYRQVRT
jgi:glycosyltransferase involved in cell wall biosynthesis